MKKTEWLGDLYEEPGEKEGIRAWLVCGGLLFLITFLPFMFVCFVRIVNYMIGVAP